MNTLFPVPAEPTGRRSRTARPWPLPPSLPASPRSIGAMPARVGPRPLAGPHHEEAVRRRARADAFGPVGERLRVSVALPLCDRPDALPELVEALAAQGDAEGSPFARGEAEALVLLAREDAGEAVGLLAVYPWLRLSTVACERGGVLPAWARQVALDAACVRLLASGRPEGLVVTADSPMPPDWLVQASAEAGRGADVALANPDAPFDAGFAVSARAYAHVGGFPSDISGADRAFLATLTAAGAEVRSFSTAPCRWPRPLAS